MPCYLFTYHTHGSWMPDHPRGYVKRREGVKRPDDVQAGRYRSRQNAQGVWLNRDQLALLVGACGVAAEHLDATVHAVFGEPTHLHVLLSWRYERGWHSMRTSLKRGLTEALNQRFGKRVWWSDGSSRKQVKDDTHFVYLLTGYCDKHRALRWVREQDQERIDKSR